MKVLVTGGAGYVGSHACKVLAQKGHEVVVYDNLSTGHREFVKWGPLWHGDIRDQQSLRACARQHRPDGVIHFAASAYVGESVVDPGKYYDNNAGGTLSLLRAMRDEGVSDIVASSSCAVYGQPEAVPITEACPLRPINPYGASKQFMERMLADFEAAHGLQWISLRYFNAAGCDPEGEVGEWHDPETHLIPLAIRSAMNHAAKLTVFGNDYATKDGTCIRDYVHVMDLAEAHILALEHLQRGGGCMPINLGTGAGFSILEILEELGRVSGHAVPYEFSARRAGDPAMLIADPSRAQDILNWKVQHATLRTILETAWGWEQGRPA